MVEKKGSRWERTSSSPSRPSGSIRKPEVHDEEHPESGGRRDARVHEGGRGALQRRARARPPVSNAAVAEMVKLLENTFGR